MKPALSKLGEAARLLTRYELWLLGVAAPFLLFPSRWAWAALALIALTWLSRWVARGSPSVATPMDLPILLLLLMTVVGLWVSIEPAVSAPKAWAILLGVALYYGLANSLRIKAHIRLTMWLFLLMSLGVAFLSLIGTYWEVGYIVRLPSLYEKIPLIVRNVPSGGIPSLWEGFHPREVGGAMGLLMPVAVALCFFGRGRIRWLAAATSLVTLVLLLLSQTPNAMAGVIIAILLMALYRRPWLLVPTLALVVVLPFLLQTATVQALLSDLLDSTHRLGAALAARLWIHGWALAILADVPFTGVGLNMFGDSIWPLYLAGMVRPYNAHNLYLQNALDMGFPGLIAFLGLMGAFGYTVFLGLRLSRERNEGALLLGLAGGVLSLLIYGLLDTLTLGMKPGAALWGMLGIAAALARPRSDGVTSEARSPRLWHFWKVPAILLSVLLVLALLGGLLLRRDLVGTFPLNLGTIYAHKVLTDLQKGEAVPVESLHQARALLRRAEEGALTSRHSLVLLGSLSGYLGDYSAAVDYLGRAVEQHAEWPVQLPLPTAYLDQGYTDYIVFRHGGKGNIPPRDDDLERYFALMTRYPSQWQPYLAQAIVLYRYLGDKDRAEKVLQEGMERATWPGPLSYYLQELRASSAGP